MRTFLFLALRTPELTARLVRAAARSRATVVLDLEDALWDVTDPARTAELKATGRATLVALARDHPELFRRQPVGVRVNRVAGDDAEQDFEAIERVSALVPVACVVIPKVESADDIAAARTRIRRLGLPPEAIVPILETRSALAALDSLLPAARSAGVEWIVFGFFDFALDSGWWPFPDRHGDELWAVIRPFLERVEDAGMRYIEAPYAQVDDDAGLVRILDRLERTCDREFGVLTVGLGQASVAQRFAAGRALVRVGSAVGAPGHAGVAAGPVRDALDQALRVVEVYDARHRPDTSFVFDPETGQFIPPHVYLGARRYLAAHHRA
ncbi:MAG TPA: aldolase/citrate lyase family protein [Candidatus Limnocylindrales bacterium]